MNKKVDQTETESQEDELYTEEESTSQDETESESTTEEESTGEDQEGDESEAEGDEDSGEDGESSELSEITVSIGEEAPPPDKYEKAPAWVRDLRKANREKDKKIRELESRLNQTTESKKPVELGKKPTLEDHDYDTEQYEQALTSWFDRKREVEAQAEQAKQTEQNQQKAWQEKLDSYAKAKAALKVRDYEEAEATVSEVLSVTQQGIVLQGSENPALVMYALGKNPAKAAKIAELEDPVKFAFAVAKLEKDLKVTNKKTTPPPERTVNGTGRNSGVVDSTLEKLRAEAERTGNYTKVTQYRKQKRQAAP